MEYTEEYLFVQGIIKDADKKLQKQNDFFNSSNITSEEKSDYRTFLTREVDNASVDIDEECLASLTCDIRDFYCADRFCSSFEGKAFLQRRLEKGCPIHASDFLNNKAKSINDLTKHMLWKNRDDIVIITKEILEEFQGSFEYRFAEEDPEMHFLGIYKSWQNRNLSNDGTQR